MGETMFFLLLPRSSANRSTRRNYCLPPLCSLENSKLSAILLLVADIGRLALPGREGVLEKSSSAMAASLAAEEEGVLIILNRGWKQDQSCRRATAASILESCVALSATC